MSPETSAETRFFCAACGATLTVASDSRNDAIRCPSCSRFVPAPRLFDAPATVHGLPFLLPPEIIALEVKFRCNSCRRKLGADARWEGMTIKCPACGEKARIPFWSRRTPGASPGRDPSAPLPTITLSAAEIEFLAEPVPSLPQVAH